jgi:transposase
MEQTQQYVGIDLHRRRSVIVRRSEKGETLQATRVHNADTEAFTNAVMAAGEHPVVVLEATFGWYWAADWLAELGCEVHLAHPLGNDWGNRRVKNDLRDAEDLADLLRMGRLAEAWIAPKQVRELRESVRHRIKLVQLRSNLKCQVHGVLAKEGVYVPMSDLFGLEGNKLLSSCDLAPAYRNRVESLREVIEVLDREVSHAEDDLYRRLRHNDAYNAIQAIPGVGPVLAAVFVAEIGDVTRFPSPDKLASWCGLTPRHRESDTTIKRGRITKQGSRLVRWAAVEAAQKQRQDSQLREDYLRIASNHGNTVAARKIARVAVARRIVTLVYYGMRDGVITSLAADKAA